MKRISDVMVWEKVKEQYSGFEREDIDWDVVKIATQAQLEDDQKECESIVEEIFERIEKLPFIPKTHDYEYYMNEVGQRERKHLLTTCELCKYQAFKQDILKKVRGEK